jgi:hypothetical protein
MDAATHKTVSKFSGINNVDSATRLFPVIVAHEYVYPLQQANNVEIDNTFQISSRSGYTSVKSGTNIQSLWSDNVTCLYADGATLYEMSSSYVLTALRTDLTLNARISYAPFNDRVYYTNEHQIGYVKNHANHALADPIREFKLPLPTGQLIDVFRGCLYVAKDDVLYISDPLCDYYDTRTGYRRFASRITLLRAVDDGIYVADAKTYFLKGKANEDYERDPVYPVRAIPYTDIRVSGKYIDDGLTGDVAMWTAENGICLGDNSGQVKNLTEARYVFTSHGIGTGFIREKNGIRHYVNSLY